MTHPATIARPLMKCPLTVSFPVNSPPKWERTDVIVQRRHVVTAKTDTPGGGLADVELPSSEPCGQPATPE
jgi:hypothetical protein